MDKRKRQLGQYFTPVPIASFMVSLSTISKNGLVLDPAVGKGVFFDILEKQGFLHLSGFEIDTSLPKVSHTTYKSFISEKIEKKYNLIIGNPPYIRWKNLDERMKMELQKNDLWNRCCNNLCDYLYIFILKSISLLEEDGELIFITPEYWLTTKHAEKLRDFMLTNGYFETIYLFSETPIFQNILSATMIFKYIKSRDVKKKRQKIKVVQYNERKKISEKILADIGEGLIGKHTRISQFTKGKKWQLAGEHDRQIIDTYELACDMVTLSDIAAIGNGMVSGLDKAFKLPEQMELTVDEKEHRLRVIKAKNLDQYFSKGETNYIFANDILEETTFKRLFPHFLKQLKLHKKELENRYNYHRNIPYWHWVFPRNYALFSQKQKKIFIPCKERISHKNFVRFTLVSEDVFPTQDVSGIVLKKNVKESIYYIVALLNSTQVFHWITHNGVKRGNILEFSEAPLNSIPIKRINWQNENEVQLHNKIESHVKDYIDSHAQETKDAIQQSLDVLLASS